MRKHKATFIQDASDLVYYLRSLSLTIMESYVGYGIDEDSVFTWIVKEHIERVHNLITVEHYSKLFPHVRIYDVIRGLDSDFDVRMSAYLKVPNVYGNDSELLVGFVGIDLYIQYYSERVPYFQI